VEAMPSCSAAEAAALVAQLRATDEARLKALREAVALCTDPKSGAANNRQLGEAGALEACVSLLREGKGLTMDAAAAELVWSLARNQADECCAAGVVELLVPLASALEARAEKPREGGQIGPNNVAGCALRTIAAGGKKARAHVVKAGGIESIVAARRGCKLSEDEAQTPKDIFRAQILKEVSS